MSGYAKIWADIFYDTWFCGLSCVERGAWLQTIVHAKNGSDTGRLGVKSGAAMGSLWGCDGKTARKILGKFLQDGKIKVEKGHGDSFEITILNYEYYQRVKTAKDKVRTKKSSGKNPAKILPIREDKIREDKIREEHSIKSIQINGIDYNLQYLFITQKEYSEIKNLFPDVNHDEELMMADMRRPDYPSKSKRDPHRGDRGYLTNWFKNSKKYNKERGNGDSGNTINRPDLSKYANL